MKRPLAALLLACGLGLASSAAAQAPAGRAPAFVFGRVRTVEAGRGRLVVDAMGGEKRQVAINVQPRAQVTRSTTARAADLRVGESVSLTGVPLTLDARSIDFGEPAAVMPPAPGRVQRPNTPNAPVPAPGGAPRGAGPAQTARLLGRITKLTPLTVTLPSGEAVEVRHSAQTRFHRVAVVDLKSVKPGEQVVVFGERGADGAIAAHRVQFGAAAFPVPPRRPAPQPRKPAPRPAPRVTKP